MGYRGTELTRWAWFFRHLEYLWRRRLVEEVNAVWQTKFDEMVEEVKAMRESVFAWKGQYEREVARALVLSGRLDEAVIKHRLLVDGLTESGLSPAQLERLALCVMAAGKLAAEAAKVVLNGRDSRSPFTGRPAYAELEHGIGRLRAVVEVMAEAGDVRRGDVREHAERARQRIVEQATSVDRARER